MDSIIEQPTIDNYTGFDQHLSEYIHKRDKLVLLLDYDGTLSPIASHPKFALIEQESKFALEKLQNRTNVYIAIISGRAVDDVREKVGLDNITYSGNHGFDIYYRDGHEYHHEISDELKDNFRHLVIALENLVSNGSWLENKLASLTFHYRAVPLESQEYYHTEAKKLIESHGFIANPAHFAIEAKPPVKWNKGEATLKILDDEFGENWHNIVKVIFAGDDTTDEDAMIAIKGKGRSFRVKPLEKGITNADYKLPSTRSVSLLLQWLNDNL